MSPRQLFIPSPHVPEPGLVLDATIDLIHRYNVSTMMIPSDHISARRSGGEWAARTLVRGAWHTT